MGKRRIKKILSGGKTSASPRAVLNVLLIVASIAAAVMVFTVMERYVNEKVFMFGRGSALELVDVPPWVSRQLKQKVYDAALALGEDFKFDENAAHKLQVNIASNVAWLENPQVQITHNSFRVRGRWRKPLGIIKSGGEKFYVDSEMAVLDFVPVKKLPVVTIRGISIARPPEPGEVLGYDDLSAAVAILEQLDRMDRLSSGRPGLLYEIESIDVSNYDGRQSNKFPHIVLFSKDNTQIIWGAELGSWYRHLEASDEEKLAKLYSFYKEHGTLSGKTETINLRDSQEVVQPIDKH